MVGWYRSARISYLNGECPWEDTEDLNRIEFNGQCFEPSYRTNQQIVSAQVL